MNNPSNQEKKEALTHAIKEQLDNLTIELDERVKNLKVLTKELVELL